MFKKLTSSLLAVAMLASMGTTVFAAENISNPETVKCVGNPTKNFFPVGAPIYEDDLIFGKAASVQVTITSPCDEYFRSVYSNYNFMANDAIERTDDSFMREFGVDFRSVAQPLWTSNGGTNAEFLIFDAKTDCGLKYNGSLTADIMVAFSGCSPDDWVSGMAYTGTPYAVIFDNGYNGYDGNAQTAQHELGHTYGLKHETCTDLECVMNDSPGVRKIDYLCAPHKTQWQNAKSKY